MSDIAAHLVDEVLPKVPARQWVCSLPWRLRYAMGHDRGLCADVLAAFVDALRISLRSRAKRELGLRSVEDGQIGATTFVQRGDSSLRLNVHFWVPRPANALASSCIRSAKPLCLVRRSPTSVA